MKGQYVAVSVLLLQYLKQMIATNELLIIAGSNYLIIIF